MKGNGLHGLVYTMLQGLSLPARLVGVRCGAGLCGGGRDGSGAVKRVSALTPEEEARAEATKARVYEALAPDDKAGFVKLPRPRPGEWLAHHKEYPQTIERYAAIDVRSRPTQKRRTIVLQPLGKFNRAQRKRLATLREYAQVFFQLPARLAEPRELKVNDPTLKFIRRVPFTNRHDDYYRQFNASVILKEILAKRVPDDAVLYMGVTCEDLWAGKLNYLFGLGSFNKPVAVMSLARFEPEFFGLARRVGDGIRILSRSLKLLNHEASHVFGLHHCVFYCCTMNGCNTLSELDKAPMRLCPVCHRKLVWALRWDAAKRYGELLEFYRTHGLTRESAWLGERVRNWHDIERRRARAKGPRITPIISVDGALDRIIRHREHRDRMKFQCLFHAFQTIAPLLFPATNNAGSWTFRLRLANTRIQRSLPPGVSELSWLCSSCLCGCRSADSSLLFAPIASLHIIRKAFNEEDSERGV